MFQNKLFQTDIQPRCAYCIRGADLGEGRFLCPKRGPVAGEDSCRSFRYDPLKRVPPKPVKVDFSGWKDEDFQL